MNIIINAFTKVIKENPRVISILAICILTSVFISIGFNLHSVIAIFFCCIIALLFEGKTGILFSSTFLVISYYLGLI